MAKDTVSKGDEHDVDGKYNVGKNEPKYTQSVKKISVTFTQNRTFPLHIGRKVYVFGPHQTKELPAEIKTHKDFTDRIKKYFVIKEK